MESRRGLGFARMGHCFGTLARAGDDADRRRDSKPYEPTVAPASDEAERAIRTFRVPAGLKVELFAAEPLLANPGRLLHRREGALLRRRDLPA